MTHRLTPLQARLADRLAGRHPRIEDDAGLIQAAVSVLFAPDPDAILFIKRAERSDDPWSGHVSFPGGRSEVGDADLMATAIRETMEEVGIQVSPAQLVAALDDVAPRRTRLPPIMVRPYVFVLDHRPELALNHEAVEAVWAPVTGLLDPEAQTELTVHQRAFRAYRIGALTVWGMTERILTPLLALLEGEPGRS